MHSCLTRRDALSKAGRILSPSDNEPYFVLSQTVLRIPPKKTFRPSFDSKEGQAFTNKFPSHSRRTSRWLPAGALIGASKETLQSAKSRVLCRTPGVLHLEAAECGPCLRTLLQFIFVPFRSPSLYVLLAILDFGPYCVKTVDDKLFHRGSLFG
jgi:hypothetical protein